LRLFNKTIYRSPEPSNKQEKAEEDFLIRKINKTAGKAQCLQRGSLTKPLKIIVTQKLLLNEQGQIMKFSLYIVMILITNLMMSPLPIRIDGQLLTSKELNPKEHQIILRRMGEYATDVTFHHIRIPILLNIINQVANLALTKIRSYAKNVNQESMIHYHDDNHNSDSKQTEG
jgi:hypothetical protein